MGISQHKEGSQTNQTGLLWMHHKEEGFKRRLWLHNLIENKVYREQTNKLRRIFNCTDQQKHTCTVHNVFFTYI